MAYETVEMLMKRAERLEQQRAELLEALKAVQKSLGHMMHPNQKAQVAATISKVEAAE